MLQVELQLFLEITFNAIAIVTLTMLVYIFSTIIADNINAIYHWEGLV